MNWEAARQTDEVDKQRLIGRLLATGKKADRHLARLLGRCGPSRACRSAACIRCGRDFQFVAHDLVDQEMRAFARRELRGRMSAITLVPTIGCLSPDSLTAPACRRVLEDAIEKLTACQILTYALSLDISFNEDKAGRIEPHWCAHVHVIVRDWLAAPQKRKLGAAFHPSTLVRRPTFVVELDNNDTGVLYAYKPDRERRVRYLNDSVQDRISFFSTKRRPLRPFQAVRLAQVEHELGFDARLVTSGLEGNAIDAALKAFYRARDGP